MANRIQRCDSEVGTARDGTLSDTCRTFLIMPRALTVDQEIELRDWIASGRALTLRTSAGLARASIARELAVADSAVWRWEHGQRIPRGDCAVRYYRVLAKLAQRAAPAEAAGSAS